MVKPKVHVEIGSKVRQNSPTIFLSTLLGPSCTEFVQLGYLHFENGATSKIDDVLIEHGDLTNVLPLAVHLKFYWWTSRGDHCHH